jgi:hypothetical protein
VLGRRSSDDGDEWCVASEDCAFGPIGFQRVRDVLPGEMIVITEDGEWPYTREYHSLVLLLDCSATRVTSCLSYFVGFQNIKLSCYGAVLPVYSPKPGA